MEQAIKFNEWMKKISNIYYSDNEKMNKAFIKITEEAKLKN
jgi:hypothetical protein